MATWSLSWDNRPVLTPFRLPLWGWGLVNQLSRLRAPIHMEIRALELREWEGMGRCWGGEEGVLPACRTHIPTRPLHSHVSWRTTLFMQ